MSVIRWWGNTLSSEISDDSHHLFLVIWCWETDYAGCSLIQLYVLSHSFPWLGSGCGSARCPCSCYTIIISRLCREGSAFQLMHTVAVSTQPPCGLFLRSCWPETSLPLHTDLLIEHLTSRQRESQTRTKRERGWRKKWRGGEKWKLPCFGWFLNNFIEVLLIYNYTFIEV